MFESAYLWLIYLLAVVHPQFRYTLQPSMVIVAWTENDGELAVRWTTGLAMLGAQVRYREVQCGGQETAGDWKTSVAEQSLFRDHPAKGTVVLNTAIMTALRAECMYEYSVGAGIVASDFRTVAGRTPRYSDPGSDALNLTSFVVYGDMGTGEDSALSRSHLKKFIKENHIDAILHMGDIAYNLDFHKGEVGDQFLNELEGIGDLVPYMVCPGNHENHDNFTHYKQRFRMPRTEENQGTNLFYSFDIGAMHIIMYNTEVIRYGSIDERIYQRQWLISDLQKANQRRDKVPWVIVVGHKPLYCNIDWTLPLEDTEINKNQINSDCYIQTIDLRSLYEDVFYEYKVDLILSGHVHKYEREVAIYQNVTVNSEMDEDHLHLNANAPVHILSGITGNRISTGLPSHTPMGWNRVDTNLTGFGQLTSFNLSHILWQEYSSADESVVDYVWIVKTRPTY